MDKQRIKQELEGFVAERLYDDDLAERLEVLAYEIREHHKKISNMKKGG